MVQSEIRSIIEIINKYKYNIWLYIYIYTSILLWKKILIIFIIILFFSWVKLVFLLCKNKKHIDLYKNNVFDNNIYKILIMTSQSLKKNELFYLAQEIFLRYIIILIFFCSLRSLFLMFDFFDKYLNWYPNYSFPKILKIHRFLYFYLKNILFSPKFYSKEINHKLLGKINIKVN